MQQPAPAARTRAGRDRESGGAAVEFALVLPLFMALVMGALDYGYFFFSQQVVTNAAREGARVGTLVTPNSDQTTATTRAKAAALTYMNANGVGCPGGSDSCITVGFPIGGTPTVTCPVIAGVACVHVRIGYDTVSLTGFTSVALPDRVQANSVMAW